MAAITSPAILAQAPQAAVDGRVLLGTSSRPVSGAIVEVFDSTSKTPTPVAVSSSTADGRFALRDVRDYDYIIVTASGFAVHRQSVTSLRKIGGVVRLQRAAAVSAVIVDSTSGRPVDARVVVTHQSASNIVTQTIRASGGVVRLQGLLPGPVRIVAVARDFAPEVVPLVLGTGESREELWISLAPAASVQGRVTDEVGRPISGVDLSLHYELPSPLRTVLAGFVSGTLRTGPDGSFQLRQIKPGTAFMLRAKHSGREARTSLQFLAEGEARQLDIVINAVP